MNSCAKITSICLDHSKSCRIVTSGDTKRTRASPKKSVRYEYQKQLRQSKKSKAENEIFLSISTKLLALKERNLKGLIMATKLNNLMSNGESPMNVALALHQFEAQEGVPHREIQEKEDDAMAEICKRDILIFSPRASGKRRRSFQSSWISHRHEEEQEGQLVQEHGPEETNRSCYCDETKLPKNAGDYDDIAVYY